MVPYSERRHRINPDEIEPVSDAALERLRDLVEARDPSALDEAQNLFRLWYRIHRHVRNKPAYPPHETWEEMALQLSYGTENGVRCPGLSFAPRGAHTIGHTRIASSQQNPTTDALEQSITMKTTMDQVEEVEP